MYYVSPRKSCSGYKVCLGIPSVTRVVWITLQGNEVQNKGGSHVWLIDMLTDMFAYENI